MSRSAGTLTRADLAETINRKLGFSRVESLALVESVLEHMCSASKKERIGRNPKTGV